MAAHLQLPRKKAPNPTDQHLGARVRMRRIMLAMSQEKLGATLGLTFQQVQKYEKGTNRIGASRLQQISHILQVPVAFFFEGAPNAAAPHGSHGSALSTAQIDDFVSDSDGLRLIGAFMRIDNAALRRRIVMACKKLPVTTTTRGSLLKGAQSCPKEIEAGAALADCRAQINQINARLSAEKPLVISHRRRSFCFTLSLPLRLSRRLRNARESAGRRKSPQLSVPLTTPRLRTLHCAEDPGSSRKEA